MLFVTVFVSSSVFLVVKQQRSLKYTIWEGTFISGWFFSFFFSEHMERINSSLKYGNSILFLYQVVVASFKVLRSSWKGYERTYFTPKF